MSDDFSRDLVLKCPAVPWGNESFVLEGKKILPSLEGGSGPPDSRAFLDKNGGSNYEKNEKKGRKNGPLRGFFDFF